MECDKNLEELFRKCGELFILEYPNLIFETGIENEVSYISFPAKNDTGFDVRAIVNNNEIIVFGGNVAHEHIDGSDNTLIVADAFGVVYDFLSPYTKIIENWVGKTPYSAWIEVYDNGSWVRSNFTRLLVWTLFRKKKKLIFQNNQLPNRYELEKIE